MSNMVVRTNILSLNSHRNLGMTGRAQQNASARLSSGFRINSAADDAAGLGISEKMRAQIRGLNMASRNAHDGISLIQTAEGAMNTVNDMVVRIRELVIQAANDTNAHDDTNAATWSQSDRVRIQDEINQLLLEIDQVAMRTEFNTRTLLDGSLSGQATGLTAEVTALVNAFLGANAADVAILDQARLDLADYEADLANAQSNMLALQILEGNIMATTGAPALQAMMNQLQQDWADFIVANPAHPQDNASQATWLTEAVADFFGVNPANITALTDVQMAAIGGINNAAGVGALLLAQGTFIDDLRDEMAVVRVDDLGLVDSAGAAITATDLSDIQAGGATLTLVQGDITAATGGIATETGTIVTQLGLLDTALAMDTELAGLFGSFDEMMEALNAPPGNPLWFQVGANQGQGVNLSIEAVNVAALSAIGEQIPPADAGPPTGFSFRDLWTGEVDANGRLIAGTQMNTFAIIEAGLNLGVMRVSGEEIDSFLTGIDFALGHVLSQRSNLGAMQNRLEFTIENLDIASENLSAANSRIRDADMALEMMRLTQANVLQQAATVMLAQANHAPQSILQLLG